MRIAVLSDIHGNALALEAVLADIATRSVDLVVNLGDHLSGPLEPGRTADMLLGLGAISIRGNHDRYLLEEPPEAMDAVDRFAHGEATEAHRAWLRALPETAVVADSVLLCHGVPGSDSIHWMERRSSDGHMVATPEPVVRGEAEGLEGYEVLCCGHSHVARSLPLRDGRLVFNPGSVGRPAYTMADPASAARLSPAAGYGLLERNGGAWRASLLQVAYDHERAARMAKANGSRSWSESLASGWRR